MNFSRKILVLAFAGVLVWMACQKSDCSHSSNSSSAIFIPNLAGLHLGMTLEELETLVNVRPVKNVAGTEADFYFTSAGKVSPAFNEKGLYYLTWTPNYEDIQKTEKELVQKYTAHFGCDPDIEDIKRKGKLGARGYKWVKNGVSTEIQLVYLGIEMVVVHYREP